MRCKGIVARAAAQAACVVAFVALTACGLNLAERAQNDLVGVDRPVSSVNISRLAEHRYRVYLLGEAFAVDLGDEVMVARRTWHEVSVVPLESARRVATAIAGACARLRARLGRQQGQGLIRPRSTAQDLGGDPSKHNVRQPH